MPSRAFWRFVALLVIVLAIAVGLVRLGRVLHDRAFHPPIVVVCNESNVSREFSFDVGRHSGDREPIVDRSLTIIVEPEEAFAIDVPGGDAFISHVKIDGKIVQENFPQRPKHYLIMTRDVYGFAIDDKANYRAGYVTGSAQSRVLAEYHQEAWAWFKIPETISTDGWIWTSK